MADYFTNVLLTQPLPADVRAQAGVVLAQAERSMPWVGSLQGPAGLIFNQGRWPMVMNAADVTSDPEQQRQWKAFVDAYSPLSKAVLKGEWAAAKAEGERLAADVNFWNTTYRVTQAIASTGLSEVTRLWDQLKEKLTQIKKDRAAAAASLGVARKVVNDPTTAAVAVSDLKTQLATLDSLQMQVAAGASSALGPLGSIPGLKEEAGLSGPFAFLTPVKLVAAGIGVAVLITVITAIALWVDKQAEIKEKATALAYDALARKDKSAETLFREGKITFDQFQAAQKQNAADTAIVAKANQDASFGGNMGKYIGIALGVVAIGAAVYYIRKGRAHA